MRKEGLHQRDAELSLFIRTVLKHHEEGVSDYTIAKRLHSAWGLHHTTYYRRLAKARQTICIP